MLTAHEMSARVGYQTKREVDFIHKLVEGMEGMAPKGMPLMAVNIGAGSGTSSLAVLETRKDITLFGIDVDIDNLLAEENVLAEAGVIDRYIGIHGRSGNVGALWPRNWMIDWLFVDGDHSGPGVRADIQGWLPHVWDHGVVLFHDYAGWPSDHPRYPEVPWPEIPIIVDVMMVNQEVLGQEDRIKAFRVVRNAH